MIFEVKDGSFGYEKQGGRTVLDGIGFSVEKGSLTAILGPNGAGKTTLLRCMMGFLSWRSGGSYLDGKDIRELNNRELWQRIAYVPQAKGAVSIYSCEEMVLLGRSSHFGMFGHPGDLDREIARQSMERLGIANLAKRSCAAISGGELQMVLIARALAAQPQMLVLDEPESNLDFKNQLIILDTMSELTQQGISCIFNTHYPTHALQRADHALLLDKQGRHIFGNSTQVITEENLARAFGVETVIGSIETKHKIYHDVLPLQVISMDLKEKHQAAADKPIIMEVNMETRLAIIAIIVEDAEYVEKINNLLHDYRQYVIGRMGMPYEKKGLSIISVVIDAPEDVISTLSGKLGMLRGISVKTTYSKV